MILPEIKKIISKELSTEKTLLNIAEIHRDMKGSVLLMGGREGKASKHNILALKPWLILSSKGEDLKIDPLSLNIKADPFDILRLILKKYESGQNQTPLASGLFGYLSYDLGRILEKIPDTVIDDINLPDLYLCAPSVVITENIETGVMRIFFMETDSQNSEPIESLMSWFDETLEKGTEPSGAYSASGLKSIFTEESYKKAVSDIKEHIAAGDVYQVNLSQRFEADFEGDSFRLFKDLFQDNPASFFARINAGDHTIVSTSPERFVCRRGKKLETRPIKGTRPRRILTEDDAEMIRELLASPKDEAELAMIVDLMRNDFGRIATPGTVKVKSHKEIESFKNVHHLYSVVEAELDETCDTVDFIKAVFPAGSITGCPKIRSMEIIDELEPVRRHIYTGSIGYLSFCGDLDLSVAIRTCLIKAKKIYFSAGGGIVFDSDPASEYQETLHKAETIMKTIAPHSKKQTNDHQMWLNGFFMPESNPFLRVSDQGASGIGFFETIYYVKGRIFFLGEHLERFNNTWNQVLKKNGPGIPYKSILETLIEKNRLTDKAARIRITAHAVSKSPGYLLSITANPYEKRQALEIKGGLDIVVFPEKMLSHFSEHKTTSRIFHGSAGEWALSNKGDEALILDHEGHVLETNTANIIMIKGQNVFIPETGGRLSGIMEKNVLKILKNWGYSIKHEKITLEDLFNCDGVFLTNSLMGIASVLSVNGKNVSSDADLADKINSAVSEIPAEP